MAAETSRIISVRCNDGVSLDVELDVLLQCFVLRDFYFAGGAETVASIPIENFDSVILTILFDLLKPYKNLPADNRTEHDLRRTVYPVQDPLVDELKKLDNDTFERLTKCANYLNCSRILNSCCIRIIDALYKKDVSEVRRILRIPNDNPMTAENPSASN